MAHFNEEQLRELETVFGLVRAKDTLPIKDGVIARGDKVWWRGECGPEHLTADDTSGNWDNIKAYPDIYSHKRPYFRVEYLD
ncbi:hypothetical protein D3C87_475750 [compost metagenome]